MPTSKEADELIALANKHQRLLTVYQSLSSSDKFDETVLLMFGHADRRWDSDFLTVKELLTSNTLGRIVEFESHFDRYKPSLASPKAWKIRPEPGGGAIYDLGTHLIDQIVVLFGLPRKITAFLGSQRSENPNGYEDSCTVLLHYEGMLVTAKVAVVSPEAAQLRFWVRGEKGSYKKSGEDVQEMHLAKGMKLGDDGFGIEPEDRSGTLTTVEDGNLVPNPYPTVQPVTYRAFYSQFVQALSGKGEVPVKPEDASTVIRLIQLAKRSSEEGKTLDV